MGIFRRKKQDITTTSETESALTNAELQANAVFDEAYRAELRELGRQYFKDVISENKRTLQAEFANTFTGVAQSLRSYVSSQLGVVVEHISRDLRRQFDAQLAEHTRVLNEAQDISVQSLTRNAQTLHDKYNQLSRTLEQVVASQETQMIKVLEEQQARVIAAQSEQNDALAHLKQFNTQADQLTRQAEQALIDTRQQHDDELTQFKQNVEQRMLQMADVQVTALSTLQTSATELQQQYDSLRQTVDETVAKQQSLLMRNFTDNMTQVVEHYLLAALGDQFDVKAQLPGIIRQLEDDKAAMIEDISL